MLLRAAELAYKRAGEVGHIFAIWKVGKGVAGENVGIVSVMGVEKIVTFLETIHEFAIGLLRADRRNSGSGVRFIVSRLITVFLKRKYIARVYERLSVIDNLAVVIGESIFVNGLKDDTTQVPGHGKPVRVIMAIFSTMEVELHVLLANARAILVFKHGVNSLKSSTRLAKFMRKKYFGTESPGPDIVIFTVIQIETKGLLLALDPIIRLEHILGDIERDGTLVRVSVRTRGNIIKTIAEISNIMTVPGFFNNAVIIPDSIEVKHLFVNGIAATFGTINPITFEKIRQATSQHRRSKAGSSTYILVKEEETMPMRAMRESSVLTDKKLLEGREVAVMTNRFEKAANVAVICIVMFKTINIQCWKKLVFVRESDENYMTILKFKLGALKELLLLISNAGGTMSTRDLHLRHESVLQLGVKDAITRARSLVIDVRPEDRRVTHLPVVYVHLLYGQPEVSDHPADHCT